MRTILETRRLILRELCPNDFHEVCKLLQDNEVMYAYEGAFNGTEVREWLDRQIKRYAEDKVGLWGAVLKENGELIGQCGITKISGTTGMLPKPHDHVPTMPPTFWV